LDYIYGTCNSGVCQQITPPPSFDWRNYNGDNWMTPIKNQSSCRSCWAFATVGAAEAKWNIQNNDPNLNIDLSEQYLVSDCCNAGSCGGGNAAYSCDITDEACYSYTASNSSCSNRCSDWSNRVWDISNNSSLPYTQQDKIKQQKIAIMTKGPLYALNASSYVWDNTNGYYYCSDNNINHAVVLVGWDDVAGYWIVRNSWGTGYGDQGYFYIGYGECNLVGRGYLESVIAP